MEFNLDNLQPIIIFVSGIAIAFIIARIAQNILPRKIHMRIADNLEKN